MRGGGQQNIHTTITAAAAARLCVCVFRLLGSSAVESQWTAKAGGW